MKRFLIGLVVTTTVVLFYHQYFFRHLVPVPLDIVTNMYLPWLDQSRAIFPNGGPVKNPLPSDVVSLTLPLRYIATSIFKQGQFPLWNPSILAGTPLLANFQSAAFNPLNLLYWLPFSFLDIWSLQIILQPIFAFLFFYLFISRYAKSSSSRLISSTIWAFNGFFSLWFQYNTVVYAGLFIPLLFWGIDNFKTNWRYGFIISLAIALSVFCGNPPITLIVIAVSATYGLYLYYCHRQTLFFLVVFFLLGLIISLPQLWPGLEAASRSIRQNDHVAESSNIKYLPFHKTITLVTPDFFGHPSNRNTWKNEPQYDNTTLYIGILPLIVLSLSFYFRRKLSHHHLGFFYFLLLGSFIFMLPTPLSLWLGKLNFLGLSSMVFTRLSLIFCFSIAYINALTLDYLFLHRFPINTILRASLPIFISIVIPTVISFVLFQYFKSFPQMDYDWQNQIRTAFRNCFYPLIFFIFSVSSLIFLSLLKKTRFRYLAVIIIFVCVTTDLYRFFQKYNSFSPRQYFYPSSELTDYLTQHSFRFARESAQIIPSNMWSMYPHLQAASGYDTTYSQTYGNFVSLVNGSHLDSPTNRFLEIDRFDSPLLNHLSLDHLVVTKKNNYGLDDAGQVPSTVDPKQFKLVKDYGRYQLLQNTQSLPFIRPVQKIITTTNLPITEKLLTGPQNSQIAIIDTPLVTQPITADTKISQLNYSSQRYSFNTQNSTAQPSFIVISQNYDPNWYLTIDQQPHPITRTNHTLTGILVPPGDHTLKLTYRPLSFYFGLKISLFTISLSLLIVTISQLWPKIYHPR